MQLYSRCFAHVPVPGPIYVKLGPALRQPFLGGLATAHRFLRVVNFAYFMYLVCRKVPKPIPEENHIAFNGRHGCVFLDIGNNKKRLLLVSIQNYPCKQGSPKKQTLTAFHCFTTYGHLWPFWVSQVSFNSAINVCSRAQQWQRALQLFSGAKEVANVITYSTAITACSKAGTLAIALWNFRILAASFGGIAGSTLSKTLNMFLLSTDFTMFP